MTNSGSKSRLNNQAISDNLEIPVFCVKTAYEYLEYSSTGLFPILFSYRRSFLQENTGIL